MVIDVTTDAMIQRLGVGRLVDSVVSKLLVIFEESSGV
jgi:hypothetical protein